MSSRETRAPEIALAMAINIIAGLLVYIVTRGVIWAVSVVTFLQVILITYLLTTLKKRVKIPGVVEFITHPLDSEKMADICAEAQIEYFYLGISGKSFLFNDRFREGLIRGARGATVAKFLLLHPDSQAVHVRASEEGDTAESWRREIIASLIRLRQLKHDHDLHLEVRLYTSRPVLRLVFLDGHRAYVSWYPRSRCGYTSPFLALDGRQGDTLYEPLRLIADDIWATAVDGLSFADIKLDKGAS